MTHKVNYDVFCEKLKICIMSELKGSENVVEVTKKPSINIVSLFKKNNKPKELTDEEKNLAQMRR